MNERTAGAIGRGWSAVGAGMWATYLLSLVATFCALFAAYSGTLVVLSDTGNLPPPAIINELCGDEKLRWLRDTQPQDPNLLVVGSSIAWRNVDSEQFVRRDPSARPLNGGFCHTQINQAEFVTDYLIRHYPTVRTVVAVVAPQDMLTCSRTPTQLFDPATADGYAFDRRWAYPFYIEQFDAVSLARNASVIREMRQGGMQMSAFGDGPMDIVGDGGNGLQYFELKPYDPACFASLRTMAERLRAGGRQFFIAAEPINPAWSGRYDANGARQRELVANIRSAVAGTGTRVWDGHAAFAGVPSEFTDAIHLNWTAAHRFTAMLAAVLGAGADQSQDRS